MTEFIPFDRRYKTAQRAYADGLWNMHGSISKHYGAFALTPVRTGQFREGFGFNKSDCDAYTHRVGWAISTEDAFLNIIEELKGNYSEVAQLWAMYDEKLKKFRGEVKNDIASLEAAARKTTEGVQRMNKAYADVVDQMNSPAMEQAIKNAERLAAAMTTLANAQSQQLSFTVVAPRQNE